jgi:hypothetical protein
MRVDCGYAILGQAARSRKTDLVQFLLDSGADVNSRDPGQGLRLGPES